MKIVLLVILSVMCIVNLYLVNLISEKLEVIDDTLVDLRILYNKTQLVFREIKDFFLKSNSDQ